MKTWRTQRTASYNVRTTLSMLEQLKNERQLSDRALATLLHCNKSTISNIKMGRSKGSLKLRAQMAELLAQSEPVVQLERTGSIVEFCGVCCRQVRSSERVATRVAQGGKVIFTVMHKPCYHAALAAAAQQRKR